MVRIFVNIFARLFSKMKDHFIPLIPSCHKSTFGCYFFTDENVENGQQSHTRQVCLVLLVFALAKYFLSLNGRNCK